jgi:plastocyanin
VAALACLVWTVAVGSQALAQETHAVETRDNVFEPAVINIQSGDSITFRNTGIALHNATAKNGTFATGDINPGQSRTVTVRATGTVDFVCTYHEALGMVGQVISGAGAAAPVSPSPSPSPSPTAAEAAPEEEDTEANLPIGVRAFPFLAFGLLVILGAGVAIGYLRTLLRTTESR